MKLSTDDIGSRLSAAWRIGVRTARLMIGVPDYAAYLAHHRMHHGEAAPMTEAEFFRSRQDARYRRGGSRCC